MLVLSRKEGERVAIGDNIVLVINKIAGNRVTIGIEAPKHVKVVRGELDEVAAEDAKVRPGSERPMVAIHGLKEFVAAATKLRHVG